jgi:uncharacterized membrane protein YqjE
MNPDASGGSSPSIASAIEAGRRWVASLVRYAELRFRLLGLEAKEAGLHLLVLALLLVSSLVFLSGFLVMFVVFILYLLMLIFHWDWGWSVLVCAAGLLVLSIIAGATFRFQIVKPFFVTTFAELQKDRAWLNHTKMNSK